MFQSIILPLDLEMRGDRPVRFVRRLAKLAGLPIELVTVLSRRSDHRLDELKLERRRRWFPGLDCTATVLHGNDVASAIVGHLADRQSSLVAMATNARGPVGEKAFTSVSEAVLASQVAPILLFGPHYDPSCAPEPPTLLVAVDKTEESEAVLSTATSWAMAFGGASQLVEVVPPSADLLERTRAVEHLTERVRQLAPDTSWRLVEGRRPAEALLDHGHGMGDIVMAMASGQWTDGHAHLRSVTRKVTHSSHFPVLVIPRVYAPATSGQDR